MLTVGSLISGYRIERVLGQGGMGAVYLVANPELPRREALKLLSAELSRDTGFRARFLREADVASRLDHPNIVSIHRRGETDNGQLWIAMQFVDGTDADQALRNQQMTPERAVHMPVRSPKRWITRISTTCCTGTSNPRTSCCPARSAPTSGCCWETSVSPGHSTTPA